MADEKEEKKIEGKYNYHTPTFDGPLELLLYLIQENDIDIYDIPIALITEQFLDYMKRNEAEIRDMADFYHMAADLLLIKSRMLLPVDVKFDEEYEDPRRELVDRLIEYQKYKKYAEFLSGSPTSEKMYIPRRESFFSIPYEDKELFESVTVDDLRKAFEEIISRNPVSKIYNTYEEVRVEQKITLILELLETRDKITLLDVIEHPENRMHIICSFIAILQATKDRMILIYQERFNDTIYIRKRSKDGDYSSLDSDDEMWKDYFENDKNKSQVIEDEDEVDDEFGQEDEIVLEDDDEE